MQAARESPDRLSLSWALAAMLALGGCRAQPSAKPPAALERAPDPAVVTLSPEATRAGGIEVATAGVNRSLRVLTLTGALSATPWTAEEQTALSEAENADAKLRLAEASFDRVSQLSAGGLVARQDLDVARSALEQARSTAEQTDARRKNLGLAEAAGSTARLARVWGLAALPESDLPKVVAGQAVEVKTSAFPRQVFRGKVSGISGSAGEKTRQFTVRIAVEDPGGRLRPQMLATFEISGAAGAGVGIPSSAVLIQADGSYVYVASGNTFLRRAIRTGGSGGGQVEVTQGLLAGERVVVEGAQLLESERLKSGIKTGD